MGSKIIIGGDFCVSPEYASANLFSEELIELLNQTDINVINLECPVIKGNNQERITKSGPTLYTNDNIFEKLKQLNISIVTLANNHILDFGTAGVKTTIEGCNQNNIKSVGAGENLREASKPIIIDQNGIRIAFVNFCENEFSIATPINAGANPLNIIDNLDQIKKAKADADFVMVIIHGGHEHYNLPSPRMIKQYRFFAENGADAIIGHHTHCVSGYEIHEDVPIFYGLGNMLFTLPCEENGWYNGLLLQLELNKKSPIEWNLIPISQSSKNFQLSISDQDEKKRILHEVDNYSKIISDTNKLELNWDLFVEKKESQYINVFSPINSVPGRYIRAILRRIGLNNLIFRKNFVTQILNHIECEAHYDLSKAILQLKSKKL